MVFLPYYFLVLAIFCLPVITYADSYDNVVVCGGFIRWKGDVDLDFAKLKVNLYSELTGTLKEVTDVLPNGAYSVPLYDDRLYRLRLSTPSGWLISPPEGYVLDLRSHPTACSANFNFKVHGFSIFGQVITSGLTTGPTGLSIKLFQESSKTIHLSNATHSHGFFVLTPVLPGSYELTVSDDLLSDAGRVRAQLPVKVTSDSVHVTPIVLLGHFLRGRVVGFDKLPLVGTKIFIFRVLNEVESIQASKKNKVFQYFTNKLSNKISNQLTFTQQTQSNNDGYFGFDRLPGGNYTLFPFYFYSTINPDLPQDEYSFDKQSVNFTFQPDYLQVEMEHTDLDLGQQTFILKSFRLRVGRIVWPTGLPVAFAKILLNTTGFAINLTSDERGYYQLGDLVPGTYEIQVKFENALFSPFVVRLTPESHALPDIKPDKILVCGTLNLVKGFLATNLKPDACVKFVNKSNPNDGQYVEIKSEGSQYKFCSFLIPGNYTVYPVVRFPHSDGQFIHLRFSPMEQYIDLSNGPIHDMVFHQVRAKLTGQIYCLIKCPSMEFRVFLKPLNQKATDSFKYEIMTDKQDPKRAYFEAENILPGEYLLTILHKSDSIVDGWCWDVPGLSTTSTEPSRVLHVNSEDLHFESEPLLNFYHTGYVIFVQTDLPVSKSFAQMPDLVLQAAALVKGNVNKTKKETLLWNLNSTFQKICLPKPDQLYKFQAISQCVQSDGIKFTKSAVFPSRDCFPQAVYNPVLQLSLLKVPLFLHFELDLASIQFLKLFGKLSLSSIPIQVEILTEQQQQMDPKQITAHTIYANWSTSLENQSSQSAFTMHSITLGQSVRLRPKPPSSGRTDRLLNFIFDPSEHVIKLTNSAESSSPLMSLEQRIASASLVEPNAVPVNGNFSVCSPITNDQIVQFNLNTTVNLRGQIDPPVDEAEIHFYYNPLTESNQALPSFDHSLLPYRFMLTKMDTAIQLVDTNNNSIFPLNYVTRSNKQGLFSFNSLPTQQLIHQTTFEDTLLSIQLNISKPGYKFTYVSNQLNTDSQFNWLVKSTKLSLVEVIVLKQESLGVKLRVPLQDVLISIVGEEHRASQLTDENGVVRFVGLAPGQYYLRPMMKEYTFIVILPDPSQSGQAIPVVVLEGISSTVELSAHRVAFSVSGMITSLANIPQSDVLVEAKWLPNPSVELIDPASNTSLSCSINPNNAHLIPHEQTSSDTNGIFKIRGLLPGCIYAISVLTQTRSSDQRGSHHWYSSVTTNLLIERAFPEVILIQMKNEDINGFHFYVIPELFMSILTVTVDTSTAGDIEDELIFSLKLMIHPISNSKQILFEHDFGKDSLLFSLTGADLAGLIGKEYVIRLESKLNPALYSSVETQEINFTPKLTSNEHYEFKFHPKPRLPGSTSSPNYFV